MSSGVTGVRRAWWLCAALACAALLAPTDCAAQVSARRDVVPRVGTIKDYPATGLMVGCGNWYFHLPRYAASPESFVGSADQTMLFISNSEGGNAWMNLDGRDVRLTKIRPRRRARGKTQPPWQYRHGSLRVSVAFVETRGTPANDFTTTIIITLRKGRAVRTRRAVGYADC